MEIYDTVRLAKLLRPGGFGKFYLGFGLERELGYLENLGVIWRDWTTC
jgi:hypothetical protein